jgi:hypothetical protein
MRFLNARHRPLRQSDIFYTFRNSSFERALTYRISTNSHDIRVSRLLHAAPVVDDIQLSLVPSSRFTSDAIAPVMYRARWKLLSTLCIKPAANNILDGSVALGNP